MRVNYKEGSKKLYFLIGIGVVFSTLIFVTYESSQALTIILCFVSVIAWLGVFFEVQAMKKKRIADLEMYAVNNNYSFSSKPE